MSNGWKTTAIIFIILFLLETSLLVWAVTTSVADEEKLNKCYYEICSDTDDAFYENYLCTCMNWNSDTENYETVRTKYMK